MKKTNYILIFCLAAITSEHAMDNENTNPKKRKFEELEFTKHKDMLPKKRKIESSDSENAAKVQEIRNDLQKTLRDLYNPSDLFGEIRYDLNLIKGYLDLGYDINDKDEEGNTLLYWAIVSSGDVAIIEDQKKYVAIIEDQKKIIKYLMEHGADIEARNINGDTPLISSIEDEAEMPIIEMLIEDFGANLKHRNNKGDDVLIKAFMQDKINFDLIKYLIEKGANIVNKSDDGDDIINLINNRDNDLTNLNPSEKEDLKLILNTFIDAGGVLSDTESKEFVLLKNIVGISDNHDMDDIATRIFEIILDEKG